MLVTFCPAVVDSGAHFCELPMSTAMQRAEALRISQTRAQSTKNSNYSNEEVLWRRNSCSTRRWVQYYAVKFVPTMQPNNNDNQTLR
jgi:hypothetical protein